MCRAKSRKAACGCSPGARRRKVMRLRKIQRHGEHLAEEGVTKTTALERPDGGEEGPSMRRRGNKTRPILESRSVPLGRAGGGNEQGMACGGHWREAGDGQAMRRGRTNPHRHCCHLPAAFSHLHLLNRTSCPARFRHLPLSFVTTSP